MTILFSSKYFLYMISNLYVIILVFLVNIIFLKLKYTSFYLQIVTNIMNLQEDKGVYISNIKQIINSTFNENK